MSARAILPFLCAAALTLAAVPGLARVGVVVGIAPPAPVVEVTPAPPAPGYVWQPGYWSWDGVQYVLGAGRICCAPFCSRGMGARAVGQAWRRLGMGHWPLAALAALGPVELRGSDPAESDRGMGSGPRFRRGDEYRIAITHRIWLRP